MLWVGRRVGVVVVGSLFVNGLGYEKSFGNGSENVNDCLNEIEFAVVPVLDDPGHGHDDDQDK